MLQKCLLLTSLVLLQWSLHCSNAFLLSPWCIYHGRPAVSRHGCLPRRKHVATAASQSDYSNNRQYSPLPVGISPFEKSLAKSTDVQAYIRQLACRAVQTALSNGQTLLEIDFPILVGGDQSKTQFDDFDNVQELNANRDWCVQFAPLLSQQQNKKRAIWLVFPDDKECELASTTWTGRRYRSAARFTSLRAACAAVLETKGNMANNRQSSYTRAWGQLFSSTVNKYMGGDGILADSSALDQLDVVSDKSRLALVCQPGNGGPVEDWINVKALHEASEDAKPITIVVNGALDKVRDGYYPQLFFPALARTIPFYKLFQAALILKPITNKGLYGWLFRVYPEPWQVILQTATSVQKGERTTVVVHNRVALVSENRPTYAQAVQALLTTSQKVKV